MSIIKTIFLVSICSLVLTGCANLYQPPKANEPTTIVKVKNSRTGLTTWMKLRINAIDHQLTGVGLSSTTRLHPGSHTLTIRTEFNQGLFSDGPFEAFLELDANLKAGQTYLIQAAVQGSRISVWLCDVTGRKISSTSSSYHTTQRASVVIIPSH
jgi:hypothetical protein